MQVLSVAVRALPPTPAAAAKPPPPPSHKLLQRPPSASLLLLEQIHGATAASRAELSDSFFALVALPGDAVVFTSDVAAASLNPTWNTADLPFPRLSRNNSNLVFQLWTRPCASVDEGPDAAARDVFTLRLNVSFNPFLMAFVGKSLTDVDRFGLTETIIVELADGFYKLNQSLDREISIENDEDDVKPPCDLRRLELLAELSEEFSEIQRSVEALILESEERIRQNQSYHKAQESQRRTLHLRAEIKLKSKMLDIEREKVETLRSDIQRRRNRLYYSSKDRERCQQELLSSEETLSDLGTIIFETQKFKNVSGKSFILGLKEIYPINAVGTLIDISFSTMYLCKWRQLREDPNAYFIRRVWLPHSEFSGVDEDRTSTALGWTAHAVSLIALFLDIPLRYPINPMSSRSMILDRVYQHSYMSMEFPLFMKGSERPRFEYGVFLLNKNIEQLLNHIGITVKNLRRTLPNLKSLIDSLIKADINPSDFRQHAPVRVIEPPCISEPEIRLSLATLTQQTSRDLLFKINQDHLVLDGSHLSDSCESKPTCQGGSDVIDDACPPPLPVQPPIVSSDALFQTVPVGDVPISPTVSLIDVGLGTLMASQPRRDSVTLSQSPDSDTNTAKPFDGASSPISTTPQHSLSSSITNQQSVAIQAVSQPHSFKPVVINSNADHPTPSGSESESNDSISHSSPPIRILSKGPNPASIYVSRSPSAFVEHAAISSSSIPSKASILGLLHLSEHDDDDSSSDENNDDDEDDDEENSVMNGVLKEMSIDIPSNKRSHNNWLPPFPEHLSPGGNSVASSESSSDNFRTPTAGMSPARGVSRMSMDGDTFVNGVLSQGEVSAAAVAPAAAGGGGGSGSGAIVASRPPSTMLGTLGWIGLQQPLFIAGSMFFNPFNSRPANQEVETAAGPENIDASILGANNTISESHDEMSL
ncbi:hypothetical protein BDR26DRAFT_1005572 [Obelidium mucronatum]|nr:hypothetical protein BDR26DRAFT_1005572 [Obelidium mucronatum]